MAKKDEEVEATEEPQRSEGKSVTGRPNDLPIVTHEHPLPNATFGTRAKQRVKQDKRLKAENVETK